MEPEKHDVIPDFGQSASMIFFLENQSNGINKFSFMFKSSTDDKYMLFE